MNKTEYIPVSDFAELVGVSKQSVYQRLNKSLKDYLKVEQGKKFIDISAAKEVYGIDLDSRLEQDIQQEFKDVEQGIQPNNDLFIKSLQDEISFLREQVQELNRLLDQQQKLTLQAQLEPPKDTEKEEEQAEQKGFFRRLFNL